VIQRAMAKLDERGVVELVAELLARRPGYVPEWSPSANGLDAALVQIAALFWQAIIQRLNQAPGKNKFAFLDTLGIQLIPAQAARTPVVFRLADNDADARLPANARIAAPPPPERNDQIIFETERATGLAVAKIKEVVSLWPGRDQYIDHSAAFLAGEAFQPFKKRLLQDTPHHLYIAHDTLLALAGKTSVDVFFDLTTASSEHLDIIWEYWDGKVWRQFKNMLPQCDDEEAARLDSTDGLQFSGRFILQTDCAETSKTKVNGIEAFWVRGRLEEPLPPNPAQVLPAVENVKLSASIAHTIDLTGSQTERLLTGTGRFVVQVIDDSGAPLRGVSVAQFNANNGKITDNEGLATFESLGRGDIVISIEPFKQIIVSKVGSTTDQHVIFTLAAEGLQPDKAFSDNGEVDLTNPFFPLGQIPQPGSAFYFTHQEAFSKPGARMEIYIQPSITPQDGVLPELKPGGSAGGPVGPSVSEAAAAIFSTTTFSHTLSWEYWNGTRWVSLQSYTNQPVDSLSAKDFTGTGIITSLTVPFDMAETEVSGQRGLWMRVRLISGGYGFMSTIRSGANSENIHRFPVTKPPAISKFLIGYTWQHGPFYPEHVLAFNDFQYEDRTAEARLPGETFQPFKPVSDQTPTLYLGFDKKLPVDRLGILFNIEEQRDDTNGPALLWQYFDGFSWEDLVVEDETRNLRAPGIVSFIGPADSESLARFDAPLHWLRAGLKEDGPPGEPTVNGLFPNAVHAIQHQTTVDEPIGSSKGQPNQTFAFTQIPVLEGERIEVREVAGLRANVEWRIVALEVFGGDEAAVRELDALLAREGTQTEISKGDLRLTRDRNKRVNEVWVRWQSRRHLLFSGPNDRDYVINRAQGLLLFGDATNGKVPPAGAAILARQYRTGGGIAGNVAAKTITQIIGPIGGIEEVFNPLPASGGADGESFAQYEIRGPQTLRHRGRALLPGDYETFAREASPAVAFARAIPARDPGGRRTPGWVTLLLIPQSGDPRPQPSFGLREEVLQHIETRTSADLAAAHRIYIAGPDYLPVDVDAVIVPLDPLDAGSVEQRAREALETFLHPLRGGPEGRGWDLGRDVFLSDIAAVLERVAGIDYVKELSLLLDSESQGEQVKVAADRVVVAGQIRLSLIQ
jgi:baseplate J-like protein